jgi:hypothetical protein
MTLENTHYIKVNEFISSVFLSLRYESNDGNAVWILNEIINLIRAKKLFDDKQFTKVMSDIENLNESYLTRNIIFALKSDYMEQDYRSLNKSKNYEIILEEICIYLLFLINEGNFEKAEVVAYSVHDFPGYILGITKWKEEDLWVNLQSYYYNRYKDYFLNNIKEIIF